MYVIIVYDVDVKRVGKINKFLKKYLYWRQNSVFEGEIRKSDFEYVVNWIKNFVKEEDNVVIYVFEKKYLNFIEIGNKKSFVNENII